QHVPLSHGDMSPSIVPPGGTSAAAAKPPAVRKASWKEPTTPSPDKEFLGWYEEERRRFHPSAVDPLPPKLMPRWSDWFARALAHPLIGGDVEKLRETCRRWFADPWAINLRTRCPASAFIADHIWSQHIPGQHEGSAPAQARTPADARRRADLSVGRGEDGGLEELPDTPEGRALGQVLDAMRGRKLHYAAGKLPGMVVPVRLDDAGLHLRLRDRYARTWIAEHSWDVELMEHARALGFRVHFHEPDQQPAGAAAGVLQ
ncbi:hypothetical protein, partial [Myxococcus sp. CA010]|uniref:hypothetical protein n=3 Tax=Myxococcus TaxID=32 RepID=UPI001E5B548B